MTKAILTLTLLALALPASADDATYYVKGKEVPKVEALKALVLDPHANVTKCQPQELSSKATLRNK